MLDWPIAATGRFAGRRTGRTGEEIIFGLVLIGVVHIATVTVVRRTAGDTLPKNWPIRMHVHTGHWTTNRVKCLWKSLELWHKATHYGFRDEFVTSFGDERRFL